VVDERGRTLRLAPREEVHGNPELLHKVVHVLVLEPGGQGLLLQKRSMDKDVAPGLWDTSVGGHVAPGEELLEAARREMLEELGLQAPLQFLYSYIHRNPYESELVYTFKAHVPRDREFRFNASEIQEVRFWELEEIKRRLGSGIFSRNFEQEFGLYLQWAQT